MRKYIRKYVRKSQPPPQVGAEENHLPKLGRGQSRVQVAGLEELAREASVGHSTDSDLGLYTYFHTTNSKVDMSRARDRTAWEISAGQSNGRTLSAKLRLEAQNVLAHIARNTR